MAFPVFAERMRKVFGKYLDRVREDSPLIHSITNYVTANDCANILLACGASPVMAEAPQESAEVTAHARGLCLNMGTLTRDKAEAMLSSGKEANRRGIPVVLDPVGIGLTSFRRETTKQLLKEVRFSAIRGNFSELKALLGLGGSGKGVDAALSEGVTEASLDTVIHLAGEFSRRTGAVTLVTGKIDVAADGKETVVIRGGHPMLSRVTGTGCMLSALTAAFLAVSPSEPLRAVAAASMTMALCGERAFQKLSQREGSGSYRVYLIDEVSLLQGKEIDQEARYELR